MCIPCHVTPFMTSLENFRNQLTLYLLLISTFNHGRIISHPLVMQPWGIAHSRPLQVGDYSPECICLETWRSRHLGKISPLEIASPRKALL